MNKSGLTWPRDIGEARQIQESLRSKIRICTFHDTPEFIAGIDSAFSKTHITAVACLYTFPSLSSVGDSIAHELITFPYIPGYLSFREGPAVMKAIGGLARKPGLILFDGQGIAHPRGIGLASHIGVLLGIPSLGCAKSRLIGEYAEPPAVQGSWTHLDYHGEHIGAVVRTSVRAKPVFVSPGHLTDIPSSIGFVVQCAGHYRIPEPIRRADRLSKIHKINPVIHRVHNPAFNE